MLTVLMMLACTGQTEPTTTDVTTTDVTPPGPTPAGKVSKGPPDDAGKMGKGPHGEGARDGQGPHGPRGGEGGGGNAASMLTLTEHVTNPTSGAKLATYLVTPVGDGPFPALVFVPGGTKAGTQVLKPPEWASFVEAGFALVVFDPDGRGQSEGSEDYNGHTQQDGLAAVIDWAAGRAEVDADRLAVLSFSYGVTMAAGALTRHQTPTKFFMDWEGPANRTYTSGCNGRQLGGGAGRGPLGQMDCSDEAFWSEREATTFIKDLTIPYHRVQFTQDHVQPDAESSVAMMEAAQSGKCPQATVNDEPATKTIDSIDDFGTHPDQRERAEILSRYAVSLMEQTTGKEVAECEAPDSLKSFSQGGPPGGRGGPGKGGKGKRPR